jgi:hypothetical protein
MRITRHQLKRIIREQLEEEQPQSEEKKLAKLFWSSDAQQAIMMAESLGYEDLVENFKSIIAEIGEILSQIQMAGEHAKQHQDEDLLEDVSADIQNKLYSLDKRIRRQVNRYRPDGPIPGSSAYDSRGWQSLHISLLDATDVMWHESGLAKPWHTRQNEQKAREAYDYIKNWVGIQ